MPRLIQHKSVWGGLEWGGMGWNGVEWGWNGVEWGGVEWNGCFGHGRRKMFVLQCVFKGGFQKACKLQ